MKPLLITIDGPGGAGKTTVSRILAEKLGYRYIDTGALYRGIALAVQAARIDPADDGRMEALCRTLKLEFVWKEQGLRLLCNREDVTDRIRTPEISMLASAVSARSVVRGFLLGLQRELGKDGAAVFEGRDMGTVVFPEADLKFFLDASPETRALRRFRELAPSSSISLEEVENDMRRRDANDSSRTLAPLKAAADAVRIDSSELTIEQVVEAMLHHLKQRFQIKP